MLELAEHVMFSTWLYVLNKWRMAAVHRNESWVHEQVQEDVKFPVAIKATMPDAKVVEPV